MITKRKSCYEVSVSQCPKLEIVKGKNDLRNRIDDEECASCRLLVEEVRDTSMDVERG